MSRHSYHSYADDSQIYIVCNNDELSIKQAVKQREDCITDVCEWMRNSSLKINQDKQISLYLAQTQSLSNT